MGTYTGSRIISATLVANIVDTVTLDADYTAVEILNRDGSAEIFATTDGGPTPTVGGPGCDVLPAAIGALTVDASAFGAPTVVKLISAGTPTYTVKGLLR